MFKSQGGWFLSSAHLAWKTDNKENKRKKEKFWSWILQVSAAAYENVRLQEIVITEFLWEFKQVFWRRS